MCYTFPNFLDSRIGLYIFIHVKLNYLIFSLLVAFQIFWSYFQLHFLYFPVSCHPYTVVTTSCIYVSYLTHQKSLCMRILDRLFLIPAAFCQLVIKIWQYITYQKLEIFLKIILTTIFPQLDFWFLTITLHGRYIPILT